MSHQFHQTVWRVFPAILLLIILFSGTACKTAKQKYEDTEPYTGFGVWYLGSWVGVNHFYTPALKTEVVFQENGEVLWKYEPESSETYHRIGKDKKYPVEIEVLKGTRVGKILDSGNVILFRNGDRRKFTKEPQERLRISLEDTFQGSILLIRKPSPFP